MYFILREMSFTSNIQSGTLAGSGVPQLVRPHCSGSSAGAPDINRTCVGWAAGPRISLESVYRCPIHAVLSHEVGIRAKSEPQFQQTPTIDPYHRVILSEARRAQPKDLRFSRPATTFIPHQTSSPASPTPHSNPPKPNSPAQSARSSSPATIPSTASLAQSHRQHK
jgi:hypothetical protein